MVQIDHLGIVDSEKLFVTDLTFVFSQRLGSNQHTFVQQMEFGIAPRRFTIENIGFFDEVDLDEILKEMGYTIIIS